MLHATTPFNRVLRTLLPVAALLTASPAFGQAGLPHADAQSTAIVSAAEGFLSGLSEAQRDTATFAFDDTEQRRRWSNFPSGFFDRAGLRWDEMGTRQQDALMALLGAILSPSGLSMVQDQMLADEQLDGSQYGRENYYVALLGEPSTTAPWMLQFGGHHLAMNATIVGPNVTLSPTLTGGQPIRFSVDGRNVELVAAEVAAARALLTSLSTDQHAIAVVGDEAIAGPLLGPGRDGQTLPPEGLPGQALDELQKPLLRALIVSRLGMLNGDDLAVAMASVEANLDKTYFAFFGDPTDVASAYWRVSGPTLIIEFAPQSRDGDPAQHLHNIYRDPSNEYGAGWGISP